MIDIGINNLKKIYGPNLVFENISFELHTNEIIGLIGKNGIGKTTLLKILVGEETYLGDIAIRKGLKVSYLKQVPDYDSDKTTIDVIMKAFSEIHTLKDELNKLEYEMTNKTGDEISIVMDIYSRVQTQLEISGGYEIEERLGKIITGLSLEKIINTPFNTLSGGEKTRVMLGKVLLENPDILLLDEPTNHLDIDNINWLETYLKKYNGSVILISHDRYFLDKVVSNIIELKSNGVDIYNGIYSFYKIEKERRFELALKDYENQQKKLDAMEEQIKRYRIWGEMRDSDKMYRRAKELEKRLAKIDKLDRPTIDRDINIKFISNNRTGKIVFELSNISKSFNNNELFKELNFCVYFQDTIALIGKNGCGKSTLFKIMTSLILPDSGTVTIGSNVKLGYLPQELKFNDEDLTILEVYQNEFNCTNKEARTALAKVLFTKEDVFKKIKYLSGGEKVRLKLVMLMDSLVNVLLLDEPTNHLDISSREILEESLLNYDGTIIFISHDRYFINRLASRIGEIENRQLKIYEGDYDYYIDEKQKMENEIIVREKKNKNIKRSNRPKSTDNENKEENILKSIEQKEQELNFIINEMNESWKDGLKLKELTKAKDQVEEDIERLYAELEDYL